MVVDVAGLGKHEDQRSVAGTVCVVDPVPHTHTLPYSRHRIRQLQKPMR